MRKTLALFCALVCAAATLPAAEELVIRRMKAAGDANNLTVDEADDLFAPEFTETTHGFAVGDILRRSTAAAHAKAQADSVANSGPELSIVVDVEDANNFSAYYGRHAVTVTSHGLGSFGTEVFLSQSTAGAMTATEPTTGVVVSLGFVIDANTIFFDPQPPDAGEVRSVYWPAGSISTDGTECSAPAEVTINSGPKQYAIACPMTTSETDGYLYGSLVLPDGFDQAADVTFEATAYLTTDSGAGTWHGVVDIQCQSEDEIIDSTWGTGIGLDLTPPAAAVVNDVIQDTSGAVDTDTTGEDCDPGDTLFWRWKSCDTDATPSTGCTSSAGFENDMSILGMKMEYTTRVGD